ncbi:TetR/AcrR family transcriptional regulator [Mycobacterium cookii]|uniref:TetR/AcrR family transcriptional regulator n=1 Tax=Mycobacterium cookii TaxID=1775 RepID=UPI0013D7D275|nr:TetR/AcrR family transcriptional regulator [Mycobacterium cookii]MCV7329471.1 TetR/AcrR family transcriptional regulator [Mycobacterium cookii]
MSRLAGSHPPDAAGLPRGRGRLPSVDVALGQRERILRAMMSATAELGYHAVTVGDIVSRARISRAAFYRQFAGKLECLIAAVEMGRDIVHPLLAAAADRESTGDLPAALRAIVRQHLAICMSEPEFTRAWGLELATAGPNTVELRNRLLDELASMICSVVETHESRSSTSTPRSFDYYVALIGGCQELIYRRVMTGRIDRLGELEDPLVDFLLRSLGAAVGNEPGD